MYSWTGLSARKTIQVACNWEPNITNKTIEDMFLLKNFESLDTNEQLKEKLDVQTTVNFINDCVGEEESKFAIIKINTTTDCERYVSSIEFMCDSRKVELWLDHEQYSQTLTGEKIEESDDVCIYLYSFSFDAEVNKEISLKFVKPVSPNTLWIYVVQLTLKKCPPKKKTSINYDRVEQMLKDVNLGDNARQALDCVKAGHNFNQKFPTSLTPFAEDSHLSKDTRQYIDYKFQILTDFLIIREKSINDKLDRIIELFKSKNNI